MHAYLIDMEHRRVELSILCKLVSWIRLVSGSFVSLVGLVGWFGWVCAFGFV